MTTNTTKCVKCGFINRETAETCERCSSVLNEETIHTSQPAPFTSTLLNPVMVPYHSISGWLILFGIGLVLTPLRLTYGVLHDLLPAFSRDVWDLLTTPGSEVYHPMMAPLLIFELLGNVLFILFSIVLLFLFFGKRKVFPRLMITFLVINLLFVIVDYYISEAIPLVAEQEDFEGKRELVRTVISCLIWVPYFLLSNRVKGTFIR